MEMLLWALVVGIGLLVVIERDRLLSRIRAVEVELAALQKGGEAAEDPSAEIGPLPQRSSPASAQAQPSEQPRPCPVEPVRPKEVSQATPVTDAAKPAPKPAPRQAPQRQGTLGANPQRPQLRLPSINVPAVAGIVISLIGFSFLLKLAIDFGWLAMPIELRHLLVAAAGAGFIAIGWHRRDAHVAFSRTLLGGGWATLSLTIYSTVLAFEILDPAVGFGLLGLSVAAAGGLASRLRSRTLAVLALCGGIAAPLLLLEGGVALSSVLAYYALFSAAGLALSLRHDWPLLHLLAFAGTFGSAALWVVGKSLLRTIEPASQLWIGVLFALYLGIVLISVLRRQAGPARGGTGAVVRRALGDPVPVRAGRV